jgi:hypothetical protein
MAGGSNERRQERLLQKNKKNVLGVALYSAVITSLYNAALFAAIYASFLCIVFSLQSLTRQVLF